MDDRTWIERPCVDGDPGIGGGIDQCRRTSGGRPRERLGRPFLTQTVKPAGRANRLNSPTNPRLIALSIRLTPAGGGVKSGNFPLICLTVSGA
jgi:hypothetical protein